MTSTVDLRPIRNHRRALDDKRTAGIFLVEPDEGKGLQKRSQVMVDKAQTVPREKLGAAFGHLDDTTMLAVTRALAVFLGVA